MATNFVQAYDKGAVLFVPGDAATSVYFILAGTIIATQGDKQSLLGVGGFLGDAAFFREIPHSYAAVCATDVKVLEMNKKNMTRVLANQPGIACSLLQELALKVTNPELMQFFQGVKEEEVEKTDFLGDLLPQGHPEFNLRVPAEYNEYLFSTEVTCPMCSTSFTGLRMRTTRLQVERHDPDFRAVYRNFEPNFYYIWVCPQCLFAYPERQYKKIRRTAIQRGRQYLEESPAAFSFAFDGQRTVQQVITSYYLAMRTFEVVGASPEQWANLWLRLVWIYEDLKEEQLALEAAEKARNYFAEAMSTTARSAAGDQQLYILLGEFSAPAQPQ
ncbi:MAG TPA: DUF2225 domain-containing protein, partial [Firmicutes bacterium]|nr:DUF2225 domain-containing protein [Bacillota bacterium]